MIIYRCVCGFKKYFSTEVLICPVCGGSEFLKLTFNMAHPEPSLPPQPQPTNSSRKSTNPIGEVKIPAIGNSPCQREELASAKDDIIFPYEDSAVNEFHRNEDCDASNFPNQNILSEQEQLLKHFSKNHTAMITLSPGIHNAWCQTQTSHVQDKEAETPCNFNYILDPFSASSAKPQHLMNFCHQSSKEEHENQSSMKRMLGKQITVESSQIENQDSPIYFTGSSFIAPESCTSHYLTENVINKKKFRDTNQKSSNSSDLLNKRGDSSNENFLPEDLEREKEVSKQKARTSQQQKRIEGGENYRRKLANTSKKRLKCWKCRKGFRNESELNIHVENPCEPMQNKRDQCSKEFSHDCRVNYVPEQEAHTSQQQTRIEGGENALRKLAARSQKGFKCWNCRNIFTYVSELHIHMQNPCEPKHGKPIPGELNQYKCGECSAEFSHEWKLEEHLVVHWENPCEPIHSKSNLGEPNQYEGGGYSEEFSHEWKLKEYLEVHWEVGPFECEHCDFAFNRKENLTSHMKKYHESEMETYFSKPESKNELKCGKCSRKFTNESELNDHLQENSCDPNPCK
ncbi:hypothetical protein AVEN_21141-1 [Araneus ventricosus]|uniref:C2H2-type domain-containing protein n=1 Tax=Araneus ventricosus TaxID=182803 RepID=A0A4Y2ULZ4_ARAVE|nr:hypothetical protein AVEN_21141-1 [Araneus ventricosus]